VKLWVYALFVITANYRLPEIIPHHLLLTELTASIPNAAMEAFARNQASCLPTPWF
jgi:hypothetical protein